MPQVFECLVLNEVILKTWLKWDLVRVDTFPVKPGQMCDQVMKHSADYAQMNLSTRNLISTPESAGLMPPTDSVDYVIM